MLRARQTVSGAGLLRMNAPAQPADLPAIRALLAASGLPGEDLDAGAPGSFWVRGMRSASSGWSGSSCADALRSSGRSRSGATGGDMGLVGRCSRMPSPGPPRSARTRSIC